MFYFSQMLESVVAPPVAQNGADEPHLSEDLLPQVAVSHRVVHPAHQSCGDLGRARGGPWYQLAEPQPVSLGDSISS